MQLKIYMNLIRNLKIKYIGLKCNFNLWYNINIEGKYENSYI